MTALAELLGPGTTTAFGWALLHFLWQGALVSLLLVALLWLLRAADPSWRYLVSCLALALMVPLPLITYAVLAPRADRMPELAYDLAPASQPWRSAETGEVSAVGIHQTPADEPLRSRLEPFLPYLVTLWLLGIMVFSARLLGGLWLLRKLKMRFHQSVSEELRLKCSELARRLGVTRAVSLRESLAVKVPLVVGWLRPMILLPTSAISGLNVYQLEMILAHELAHIRRNDYLVNLLQNLAETLLFYHPAVWWVSAKIREEREHLCDDMAVRACNGDRLGYARTLAKLDDLRLEHLAPAATGGSLVGRIRRLAGKTLPGTPDPTQWTVGLVLILVPVLTFTLASANQPQPSLLGTYVTEPFTVEELTRQGFSPTAACENSGPWLMVFSESGFFSGNFLSEEGCEYQNPFVTGSWRLSGRQLTFRDSQDLGCGLEEYSYTYRLRNGALTFSPVKDSCRERIYLFTTHVWKRPP
jgi:bla regulator protein blaR1